MKADEVRLYALRGGLKKQAVCYTHFHSNKVFRGDLLKLEFKSYGMTCKEQMPAERHREIQCSCLEASISVALLRKGEPHGECTDIVNIFRATPRN